MSNDILSGGRIDESTDGPNPPSVDDRSRNILQEQKAQQDQDAVGGTQFPPRVEPLPPIPVAPEVAPPLPVVPSFDFNFSGSPLEEVREITRQAIADAFKNVTINGQSPSIEGSTISFNVSPPQPSASESFSFQNGNANPVVPTAPIVPSPQQQPREEVQSVAVPPPSRPREEPESMSEQRERENNERETRDRETRVSLGLDAVSPMDRPSETVTTRGPSISEQNDERDTERSQRDANVRESAGLEGESPMDEKSDQARAYEAAESRREERRESDPNFNRESSIRQRGETPTEFKERQEQLKQDKIERAEREEKMARVRDGDLTEMPSGMIPVRFTRADGQRKILALMATELVGTVEGATAGERTLTLPPEDSFFEGGGGGGCIGLALYTKTVGTGQSTSTQVWISAGTVAGNLPSGFDPAEGKIIASSGSGDVWAEIQVNNSGEITSRSVQSGSYTWEPERYLLGNYVYDGPSPQVTNYGCGSVDAAICRNWYASEEPFYNVLLNRCGCAGQ